MKMKKTKKILAVLMSMIVIMGVCGVGTGCDPNKETEAEYKARIKKELDEIPVEATGYKLAFREQGENPPYDSIMYLDGSGKIYGNKQFAGHYYDITVYNENGIKSDSYKMDISVDDGEKKNISFNCNEKYINLGGVQQISFYNDKIFIVRWTERSAWISKYSDFFPQTLFIYDYEFNTLKYMGYYEEWFNYSIYDGSKYDIKIIKTNTNDEGK